ncbi:hypothetical protein BZA05DRAFT_452635 [Tricharina praecox]|uniref:uncharacterized protein n=1 Tax=Tricharina praecox TaxID=43433 RepID=UPI00221F46AD|nr:uncharacterized protein BZA05DRAFT_452635 [Tricharina praecox]KAI5852393.1 hypothetical protein BZA05DRAFT_452635 [Tricharina praecox]
MPLSLPTPEEIITKCWDDLLKGEKSGIARFFPDKLEGDPKIAEASVKAAEMVGKIMQHGCMKETAIQLSLLALYDVVLLVDNIISMRIEDNGEQIETLKKTLKSIASVYRLVAQIGRIVPVKFLNSNLSFREVGPTKVDEIVAKTSSETNPLLNNSVVGTALLMPSRTVLQIEGEPQWLLRKVMKEKALELRGKYGPKGPQAVAYQFAMIGTDTKAIELLKNLDDDKELGEYIDCMPSGSLDKMQEPADKWNILPKLFLGALLDIWDEHTPIAFESESESNEVLNGRDTSLETEEDCAVDDDGDEDFF